MGIRAIRTEEEHAAFQAELAEKRALEDAKKVKVEMPLPEKPLPLPVHLLTFINNLLADNETGWAVTVSEDGTPEFKAE